MTVVAKVYKGKYLQRFTKESSCKGVQRIVVAKVYKRK